MVTRACPSVVFWPRSSLSTLPLTRSMETLALAGTGIQRLGERRHAEANDLTHVASSCPAEIPRTSVAVIVRQLTNQYANGNTPSRSRASARPSFIQKSDSGFVCGGSSGNGWWSIQVYKLLGIRSRPSMARVGKRAINGRPITYVEQWSRAFTPLRALPRPFKAGTAPSIVPGHRDREMRAACRFQRRRTTMLPEGRLRIGRAVC